MALNLVGLWEREWEPGLLPRISVAVKVLQAMDRGVSDRELLGVADDAGDSEMDRAFRRFSLELHPDRLVGMPDAEAGIATEAFGGVSAAYDRLKRSRRSRSVRDAGGEPLARVHLRRRSPDSWTETYEEAVRCYRSGDLARARAFATKTLGLSPPGDVRERILEMMSRVA